MAYVCNLEKVLLLAFLTYLQVTYVSTYQELSIINTKVCSLSGRKGKIKLNRQTEAVIVKETRSFDKWSGARKFQCKFEVKDSDNDRMVFAVIQKLKFRDSADGCIDYVQFRNKSGHTKQLCGEVGTQLSVPLEPKEGVLLSYAFMAQEEVDVEVVVASQKLLPSEELDLEIVFTSAKTNIHGTCDYNNNYIHCSSNYCILKEFINDSFVNCPFADCRDEGGCFESPAPTYHHNMSTTVTVGAITTVLACFLVFFACIWILRHYNKLCWSSDFSGQREVRMTPVPPTPFGAGPETVEAGTAVPMVPAQETAPSAPPLDGREPKILHDKDLPPSYDSLFPTSSR